MAKMRASPLAFICAALLRRAARFKLKCNEPRYAMTAIEYKGHRIEVSPVGKGWRAAIFAPGSTRAMADSPSNLEKSRSEEIVAEAKRAHYRCAPTRQVGKESSRYSSIPAKAALRCHNAKAAQSSSAGADGLVGRHL